jgi:hypothetical protein
MCTGFIKLHRKLSDWEWYQDIPTKVLFLHLLLEANHKDKKWRGKIIKRGQLITGRKKLSQETGLSEQQVRTALDKLKSTNEITIVATKLYSIVEIQNYCTYQVNEKNNNQQINQRSNQASTNEQPQLKNEKNILLDKSNNIVKFEEFWKTFSEGKIKTPLGSKKKAQDVYKRCIKKHSPDGILQGLKKYLLECEKNDVYTTAATTFLNQERYNDYVESKESLKKKAEEKAKNDNQKAEVINLFKIDKNSPNFKQVMSNMNFLGKDSQKINYSCEKQNKKIFVTDSKFNRDWINREYGMQIKETLGEYRILAKEEYQTYFG